MTTPLRRTTGRTARLAALALTALLVVTGCGSNSTSPSPAPSATAAASATSGATSGPTASTAATPSASGSAGPSSARPVSSADLAVYAQIESQVQALRGLNATKKLVPTLLDEQGVRAYMTKAFDEQVKPEDFAKQERLYKDLNLVPETADLRQLELDLESSQVIGFYDDITKQLYIVSATGTVGPSQKVTFAHEFTHALQDQNFGLARLQTTATDQSDRDAARLSIVEGDATLAMGLWLGRNLTSAEQAAIINDPASAQQQAQLQLAPAILRESLLFPYTQGLTFITHVYMAGGWNAVNKLYANPPDSTSQILHPELYDQHVRPVAVTVPAVPAGLGSGWALALQDTFGEFQLGVWFTGLAGADEAVAQWGGDRLGLYEGPNGAWAVVLNTAWRNATGAEAFRTTAPHAPHAQGSLIRVCGSGTTATVLVASDQATLDAFGSTCAG